MKSDVGLFTNTGEQMVRVVNTSRWRRAALVVAGIRVEVGRKQEKVVGPFPTATYGPRIEYAASPWLSVGLVDLPSLPKTISGNEGVTALIGSIVCPQCGRRSYNPHDVAQRYCGKCHQFHADMPGAT